MSNKSASVWGDLLGIITAVMQLVPSLLNLCNALGHFLGLVSFALVPSQYSLGVHAVGAWGTL